MPHMSRAPTLRTTTIRAQRQVRHQLYLVLSTATGKLPLWHIVRSDEIIFAPTGLLPAPGVEMTLDQRSLGFDLNVLTAGGQILQYGQSRIFGRVNPAATCCFGMLSYLHVLVMWHQFRALGRRPEDIYHYLIARYPERPYPPPECLFPVPEIFYSPN